MPDPVVRAPARDRRVQSSGFGAWIDHHLYSFVASLGRFFRKPWSTLLTIGVMAVALALPLGLWVVLGNVERFAGEVQTSRRISVFLKDDVDAARAQALAKTLRERADIAALEVRTPDEGLAIGAIPTTNDMIRCSLPAAGLRQLPSDPVSGRICRHPHPHD